MNTLNQTKKNLRILSTTIGLLMSLICHHANAKTLTFLKNQSYHFGSFTLSGFDGTDALYTRYTSGQYFRVVAYQTFDDTVGDDNIVHLMAVVDNSGIPWREVSETASTLEINGSDTTSNTVITPDSPGNVDILYDGDLTVPNGAQTIIFEHTLYFADTALPTSFLVLSTELKLDVK